MTKNRIHTIVDRNAVDLEIRSAIRDLFSREGISFLKELSLPGMERELLLSHLCLLEQLGAHIKACESCIRREVLNDERVRFLRTVPGLGAFFSALVALEIGDIGRFRSPERLCSYAGLVPSTHASGDRSYHGRITKQGNKYLRWALVEAVWPAIRSDLDLRIYYSRMAKRRDSNVAKVATARRLLTIVYYVLKDLRPFEERRVLSSPAAICCP